MENLKIRVNNEAESKEAQELFFELGYGFEGCKNRTIQEFEYMGEFYLFVYSDKDLTVSSDEKVFIQKTMHRELTLNNLRALVSLHKNPINMNKVLSEVRSDALGLLEDKEWLNTKTYEYKKAVDMGGHNKWMEIPEGAIRARFYPADQDSGIEFENQFAQWWHTDKLEWIDYMNHAASNEHSRIVWQRAQQPEELPFVDDEPSLNDQYAEIEKVRQALIADTLNERQSTYGSFEDVALTTQKIMDATAWARGQDKLPAPHHEALHMIASKMARIVNGDHNHKDSWHDIAGYATLVERLL